MPRLGGHPNLVEFLLARVAEDELRAEEMAVWDDSTQRRSFAECEAKRRIIVRCQEMLTAAAPMAAHLASRTLADLALPYADHPDYLDEWRP